MNIMPFFICSSIEKVMYRGKEVKNNPVNLSLCKSIEKSQLAWYPDNTGIPSIRFVGCDNEWVYNDAVSRDEEFLSISRNETDKFPAIKSNENGRYKIGDKFSESGCNVITEIVAISSEKDYYGNWIYFVKESECSELGYPKFKSFQEHQVHSLKLI